MLRITKEKAEEMTSKQLRKFYNGDGLSPELMSRQEMIRGIVGLPVPEKLKQKQKKKSKKKQEVSNQAKQEIENIKEAITELLGGKSMEEIGAILRN